MKLSKNGIRFMAMCLLAAFAACSSSSSGGSSGTAGQISGLVTAPNGDPISGATVWVPEASASVSALKIKRTGKKLTDGDLTCEDTPESASDATCSATDGSFTVECTGTGSTTVKYAKGSFSGTATIDCGDNGESGDFAFATSGEGSASIAVVTGSYDSIQDVLAKLGFGTVTAGGRLDETAAFNFDLIDGDGSVDDAVQAFDLDTFLSSADNLDDYDIIFINCGADDDLADDAATIVRLQDYVTNGGKLYVTDLSYDFIEQPFPDFMDFLNGGSDPATAEAVGLAEAGTSGITSNATVAADLASWLDTVTVNTGNVDDDCGTTTVNGQTGARNEDGTVTIGHFLAGWAVMVDPHTGISPTIWVNGPISYSGGSDADAPLTATLAEGDGSVLYSSYHTAGNSCATTGFWPQERILQYLVFEL